MNGKNAMNKIPLDRHFEQMLISAERYALGRRTYIVSDTTEYIAVLLPMLSDWCIEILLRDIGEAIKQYEERSDAKVLGDDCDARQWLALREKILEEIARRHEV